MNVSLAVWFATIAGLVVIAVVDLLIVGRRSGPIAPKMAGRWIAFYIALAFAFSAFLWVMYGRSANNEFIASYVTEYSLSADNLFVFMLLIGRFKVPEIAVDRVLYLGILISLVFRAAFIAAGSAAISAFNWIFYIFGAFLIYTAIRLALAPNEDLEVKEETGVVKLLRRALRTTNEYDGRRFVTMVDGVRWFTPAILVIGAISVANLVFALDSIPAVFGITKSPYLVLTANAFAMMGLRQLYFLIGDLLKRMIYLGIGLSVLLAFIGVKLIFEALHGSHVTHVGPVPVPVISATTSLLVVVAILGVTALASYIRRPRDETPTATPAIEG
jgi:TerC family integral membrane protein